MRIDVILQKYVVGYGINEKNQIYINNIFD